MHKHIPPLVTAGFIIGGLGASAPSLAHGIPRAKPSYSREAMNPSLVQDRATILGITEDQLKAKITEGKTFAEIAKEAGLTLDQVRARWMDRMKARLQQMVAEGKLSSTEAERRIEWMTQRLSKDPASLSLPAKRPFGRPHLPHGPRHHTQSAP